MSERLAEITARIGGIAQLGAVVNAMRGIAAARARQARLQLRAVESYATVVAAAIGHALAAGAAGEGERPGVRRSLALVVFCAEQGFAGSYSERVLDAVAADLAAAEIFLVGTRGAAVAAERGIVPASKRAMPSHSPGIPRLADRIAESLYARIASGRIVRLEVAFGRWQAGRGMRVERRRLFPLDPAVFPRPVAANPPLLNLAPASLLVDLTADYIHAQLCDAALHAFAAENEARAEVMASARAEIDRHLAELQAAQRIVRQDEITAEIIELAAGEAAGARR